MLNRGRQMLGGPGVGGPPPNDREPRKPVRPRRLTAQPCRFLRIEAGVDGDWRDLERGALRAECYSS